MHQQFAKQIKTAREAAGMTRQECADAMGIHINNWTNTEEGRRPASVAFWQRMAEVVGIKLNVTSEPKGE